MAVIDLRSMGGHRAPPLRYAFDFPGRVGGPGTAMISVQDVIRLALPEGTEVVAGMSGLGREATWATRLRPNPPAFGHLNGGELVLLSPATLELLDERLTLEAAINQLAGFGVAAIAHAGPVTEQARQAAEAAGVPLLQLPEAAQLGPLERETSRLIADRRRDVQRRGQEVGRRLMELAIAGESLGALVRSLADQARRPVALESREGRLLAYHVPEGTQPRVEQARPLLEAGHAAMTTWLLATAASSPAEPPSATYSLGKQWARVVSPVIGRDGLLGRLSLIVTRGGDVPEIGILASRGAAACAVVLAREHAAASARRELELNVLDEVLDGALRSEISLLQQAQRLGHDLLAPHVALVARFDQSGPARHQDGRWSALDEIMARHQERVLWRVRSNSAEIVWPVTRGPETRQLAASVQEELTSGLVGRSSGAALSIGIGRPREGLAGIRQSHQEARQALMMGRRLYGPGHLTNFDDLGVYRIIFAAESLPELSAFHDEIIGSLVAYDRLHGAELLRTLEALFAALGSPKEAAERLHVHRNTVLYRLDRIREITGLDLDDADVRLRLQLALHIHLALFSNDR